MTTNLTPQQELFEHRQKATLEDVRRATAQSFDAYAVIIEIATSTTEKAADRLAACKLYLNSVHAKAPLEQRIEMPRNPHSYEHDPRPELALMLTTLFRDQGVDKQVAISMVGGKATVEQLEALEAEQSLSASQATGEATTA